MRALGIGIGLPFQRGPLWSPLRIPDCIGYWNPIDSLTTVPGVKAQIGESVARVSDRSNKINDLIQGDGNRQPTLAYFNGVDASAGYALDFNGSNGQLNSEFISGISGNAEISVYFTAKSRNLTGDRCPFSFGNTSGNLMSFLIFAAGNGFYDLKYINNDYLSSQQTTLSRHVLAFRKAAGPIDTTSELTFNGIVATSRGASSTAIPNWAADSLFTLGNNRRWAPNSPWDGLIGTVLVFLRRLSDTEHAQVQSWLKLRHKV